MMLKIGKIQQIKKNVWLIRSLKPSLFNGKFGVPRLNEFSQAGLVAFGEIVAGMFIWPISRR